MRSSRSAHVTNRPFRPRLDPLEARDVPSIAPTPLDGPFHPVIQAGSPSGTPIDSPSLRVDANTPASQFAGVGSIQVNTRRGTYIGSGTAISPTHILTAGHVVDVNNDGRVTSKDGIRSVSFILNSGAAVAVPVASISINPDYTGFNRPSVNDDVAVLTLATPLPSGVPIYGLPTSDLTAGTRITLVGYGQSGTGTSGYTVGASFTVKRKGENNADAFYGQDDAGRPAANEVFRFDFDGPTGNGTFGGPTLGNHLETQIGGGDSGGPSFVPDGLGYRVVGINTFTQGFNSGLFGGIGGGINVFPYVAYINSVMNSPPPQSESAGGSSVGNVGVAMSALIVEAPFAPTIEPSRPTAVVLVVSTENVRDEERVVVRSESVSPRPFATADDASDAPTFLAAPVDEGAEDFLALLA